MNVDIEDSQEGVIVVSVWMPQRSIWDVGILLAVLEAIRHDLGA